ncbi:MAG: phosphoadenylyl-sulfate reductase [Spirochaetaceae bacterium]|jgi:phosphoadenosine phosphosulfate reductase|nr:phosphoadenylyl-sulfate reductase [Spirochaetaceae bacterium]
MSSENGADCFHRSKEFLECIAACIRGPVALAHSYQAEDTVALDILIKVRIKELEVFTLDTNRLFPELNVHHKVLEDFFGITIKRCHPDTDEERELESAQGEFGMRDSLEARRFCCRVRKVKPLANFLRGKSAWFTGLRASQSVTRADMRIIEYDKQFKLIKLNPLVDWSEDDVNRYIKENGLPVNPLYAKGFRSIGCAPCTRTVKAGEDIRAGRWWWENPENRECGCMVKNRREREQDVSTIKLG